MSRRQVGELAPLQGKTPVRRHEIWVLLAEQKTCRRCRREFHPTQMGYLYLAVTSVASAAVPRRHLQQ